MIVWRKRGWFPRNHSGKKQCFLSHLIIFHSIFLMIFNFQYIIWRKSFKFHMFPFHISDSWFHHWCLLHHMLALPWLIQHLSSSIKELMFTLNGLHLRVCFPHLFQQNIGETCQKSVGLKKTCELLKLHPYLGKIAMLTNIAILDTTSANYSTPLQLPRPGGRIQQHCCRFEWIISPPRSTEDKICLWGFGMGTCNIWVGNDI